MIRKKIRWLVKRHPLLYKIRFKLLSKNSDLTGIEGISYNQVNKASEIPLNYHEVNAKIFEGVSDTLTDLEKVIKIASWLKANIKGGSGLSEPSEMALNTMLSGDGGVCSDMAQVFNNFCVINDILVREWGATSAPFNLNYGGHSFNEVYISELNQWVLIDVSYTIFFYDSRNNKLSVPEFFKLKRQNKKVVYKSFVEDSEAVKEAVDKNYLNESIVPFLICDYSNKTYDWHLSRFRPFFPIFTIHFFIFMINKSYHYKFPLDNFKDIFNRVVPEN